MKIYILITVCLAGLSGCASTKGFFSDDDKYRIEARPNGAYAAVASSEEKNDAVNYASTGAKKFCEKKAKTAIVLSTKDKYEGLTSEKGDKLLKKVGTAAMLAGVPGNATLAADSMTDDAMHEIQVEFRCE